MAHSVFRNCRKNPGIFEKYRNFSTFSKNCPNFFSETDRGLIFSWKNTNFNLYRTSPKPPRIPLWKTRLLTKFQFWISNQPCWKFRKFFFGGFDQFKPQNRILRPKKPPWPNSSSAGPPKPVGKGPKRKKPIFALSLYKKIRGSFQRRHSTGRIFGRNGLKIGK